MEFLFQINADIFELSIYQIILKKNIIFYNITIIYLFLIK